MRPLFFLSVFFLILSGCNQAESLNEEVAISTVKLPPKSDSKDSDVRLEDGVEIPQKIIKQASLRFETNDLENSFNQIKNAVAANKGKIVNDSEGKDYGSSYRNLIVKVPSQNFDSFLSSVSKGVSYFER